MVSAFDSPRHVAARPLVLKARNKSVRSKLHKKKLIRMVENKSLSRRSDPVTGLVTQISLSYIDFNEFPLVGDHW